MSLFLSIIIFSTTIFVDSCDKPLVTVDFLNTGSSDCIIINTENHSIMIDTAYSESLGIIENKLQNIGIDTLNYLILTHYDKDHIGSAAEIVKRYSPKTMYVTYDRPRVCSNAHKTLIETIKSLNIAPTVVRNRIKLILDDVEIEIIPPKEKGYHKDLSNNSSLVVSLKHQSCSFLFAADIEYDRIQELINLDIGSYDILKVPHHGWYENNTIEFMRKVSPKYSIITNVNGYRKIPQTVTAILSVGSYMYTTAKGEVSVKCYNGYYSVSQSHTR